MGDTQNFSGTDDCKIIISQLRSLVENVNLAVKLE